MSYNPYENNNAVSNLPLDNNFSSQPNRAPMIAEKRIYTQDQMDINNLQRDVTAITIILEKLDKKIDKLDSKIDGHFKWVMGSIFLIYVSIMSVSLTALLKTLNWF